MLDELWEKVTALLTLLASTGLLGWLLGRPRASAEVRQIELSTEDAHDRLIAELRQMDAEAHKVNVSTLIAALEASRQMAEQYKTLSETLAGRLKQETENRLTWEAERRFLRQELDKTQQQLRALAEQVEDQAEITEAQALLIGQQQEEIVGLKRENGQLRAELAEERERRRELEERIEGRKPE